MSVEIQKMAATEIRTTLAIASLFALRLLGLFIVLPVLSLYAQTLPGATASLVGIAIGGYGLTQALLQIPFGSLSDHYDRKIIIGIGLTIFVLGSIMAALADSIWLLILGRALQGAGAVGSATIALISDHTRENQRTKAMAILGISIGGAFVLALILGPVLNHWLSVPGLFGLSAILGLLCFLVLGYGIPVTPYSQPRPSGSFAKQFKKIVTHRELLPLNLGIFILHAMLTACFVVLPILLKDQLHLPMQQQWQFYLPTLLLGCLLILPLLRYAEQQRYQHKIITSMIFLLVCSQLWLWQFHQHLLVMGIGLTGFFTAFNLLEANLPALISKIAPANCKGTAMGIYSCSQFLGIFVGGVAGGWIYGHFQPSAVFLFCAMLAFSWFSIILFIQRSFYNGKRY